VFPASLWYFVDIKLLVTLLDYYDQAFVVALGRKVELFGMLVLFMENVRAMWKERLVVLPEFHGSTTPSLSNIFPNKVGLRAVVTNVVQIIDFW